MRCNREAAENVARQSPPRIDRFGSVRWALIHVKAIHTGCDLAGSTVGVTSVVGTPEQWTELSGERDDLIVGCHAQLGETSDQIDWRIDWRRPAPSPSEGRPGQFDVFRHNPTSSPKRRVDYGELASVNCMAERHIRIISDCLGAERDLAEGRCRRRRTREEQDMETAIIRSPAGDFPLVGSPATVAVLVGKSERAVRDDCDRGTIPTLARGTGNGSWHRIPVAKLLDDLGIPYEVVISGARRCSEYLGQPEAKGPPETLVGAK
jgi:hypothetical protein